MYRVRPCLYRKVVMSVTISKRSQMLIKGRMSASLTSIRNFLRRGGSRCSDSRVIRSTSLRASGAPMRAPASM